ncbi:MAG: sulfatase-like hydrolase/transferase [Bacteroidia bacterium]|nr:sulfatase-like hydrolase/transferase [Bacteroidia bacterium]
MKRFRLYLFSFISLLLFFISASTASAQTDPTHPNILLIIADDLGVDISNGYQNNNLMPTTPVLDSLREAGLTFDNAWAAPACTPTRASIMSGKYGLKTGALAPPANLDLIHTSIFTELENRSNNLYADAVIGKWHISQPVNFDHPQQHGVDHFDGLMQSGVDDYYIWEKVLNGVASMESTYTTSYLSDASIQWVNAQNKPWFLWLAEAAPHAPFHVPPSGLFSVNNQNTNRQKYVAAIEAMDAEIGRLLDNIPDSVGQNTLIIYVGDNGTPGNVLQNYPSGHGKGTLYQGGIHVPLIVSGPSVSRKNEREDALIYVTDIYATILESAGISLPGGIYNSLSFYPLLSDGTATKRRYNYTEISSSSLTGWTIRNERYKLIEFQDGSQEFYDLEVDPLETNNLIAALDSLQNEIKQDFEDEAFDIRNAWSCTDFIQNGDETGVDCGGSYCAMCTSTELDLLEEGLQIRIFPNPAEDILHIQSDKDLKGNIEIYTLQGNMVQSHEGVNLKSLSIDLSKFPAQLYMLKVCVNGKSTHQLIQKR